MATALSSLLPYIALSAPNCPHPLIQSMVLQSCIQFCNDTRVIVKTVSGVTATASDTDVSIAPGTDLDIVGIDAVYLDGAPLTPTTEAVLRDRYGDWKSMTGTPTGYISTDTGVRLFPLQIASTTIDVDITTRPTQTATAVDDSLATTWRETIVSGALYRLLSLPKKDWSDPNMAVFHYGQFNDGVVTGQARRIKKTSYAPLRVECA